MNFMGNLMRRVLSGDVSPDAVLEVNVAAFANVPVVAREEGLLLYGPTRDDKYEVLLQQPIEANSKTAFSLFRLSNRQSAQERFIRLREVLAPLVSSHSRPDMCNQRTLQELLTLQRDHPTWQAAHIAAKMGYVELLTLPAVQKWSNAAELEHRLTPLHIAVDEQRVPVISTLLQMGVSRDAVDNAGNSVYHVAATTTKQIIELVTTGVDSRLLNAPNNTGDTPLHLACRADKPDCVTALLVAGADVNVAATTDSCFAIHTAMAADSATCAKEILSRHPNMLHVQDMKLGGTPLHWAKSKKMINALVELRCHVNAKNFEGRTALHLMVAHDRLGCVMALLTHGARCDITDNVGNNPMHGVNSLPVLHALLVFDAPINAENEMGETALHCMVSSSCTQKKEMLQAVHALGAVRCMRHMSSCGSACSPVGTNDGSLPADRHAAKERVRSHYDNFLDDAMFGMQGAASGANADKLNGLSDSPNNLIRTSGGRLLCLDGGGIRGLVLIVLLRAVQRQAGDRPIKQLFDWIAGTSTGAILALALATGRSPHYTLGLYFRLKDEVFKGGRPYSEVPLEDILKKEFGDKTVMADITDVKVVATGVLADRFPADLHLFRNYKGGEQLLELHQSFTGSGSPVQMFQPPFPAEKQLVWEAARASGAAPSYFRAYGRFIDGGLIANNPSLDLLTEIGERNTILRALGRHQETTAPTVLLSLGTGKPPLEKVNAIDCFRPESLYGTLQMAFGLSNMAKLLIDQATMADNHTVDRCRAWCHSSGVQYMRLSPLLSSDVALDETRDDVLLKILWETQLYCYNKKDKIEKLARLLLH